MVNDKHEKKEKDEKPAREIKLPKVLSNKMAIAVVICLVVGFIAGLVFANASFASEDKVGKEAIKYINAKFLASQGAVGTLTSIEQSFGMNLVNFNITKDGKVIQSASAYVTKDGKNLIVGQVMSLTEKVDAASATGQQQPQQTAEIPKTSKPNVKFFVMAFCPYGQQAENGIGPALAELKDTVTWEPHYVIYSNYQGGGPTYCYDADSKYCSMHGVEEVKEDVRQMCIYNDKKDKWWEYVNKINSQCKIGTIKDCWKTVAKEVGFDTDKIEKCVSEQGTAMLEKEVALSEKFGVQGSPSIFVNDAEYQGGRASGDFLAGICSGFSTKPGACSANLTTSAAAATGGCG
jgi:hypothetical protein